MSARATQLAETADAQITSLIDILAPCDQVTLHRPCPGREKLGDGTIAASARHAADNYLRILGFVQTAGAAAKESGGRHRIARLHRAREHRHGAGNPASHEDATTAGYAADLVDRQQLLEQLASARSAVGAFARLTDSDLESVPPAGAIRFADGQRTLEQVLAGMLNHQGHQVEAIAGAVAAAT
jgi:hypothetical protein